MLLRTPAKGAMPLKTPATKDGDATDDASNQEWRRRQPWMEIGDEDRDDDDRDDDGDEDGDADDGLVLCADNARICERRWHQQEAREGRGRTCGSEWSWTYGVARIVIVVACHRN